MIRISMAACLALLMSCNSSTSTKTNTAATPFNEPPAWAAEAIWYQVFVERFSNGDSSNDPTAASIAIPPIGVQAPAGWHISSWTGNWYQREDYATDTTQNFNATTQYRRYGGDLQGLLNKLDYLQDLGINALYINPVNDAPSLHKYDASSYHHVDVHFGPDPAGDRAIIASENPADPATWQWTAADKLFLKLIEEAHKRNIRVVLDYSWNHTGTLFWAWQDILKNGANSKYKDWYNISQYDDPATPENEMEYAGWLNIRSLPEIKKVNLTTERKIGHPYEGDINAGAKQHIFDVTKRWLAPNGDTTKGVDGYRLDVADHVGMVFWRDWRKVVRQTKSDAYLVGEIWWEEWPDRLMNPVPYTQGDIFDAVMFYQAYRPAKYFFSQSDFSIDAAQFRDSLTFQWNRLLPANQYAMMNVSSTHDAPRLLTCFYNPGKYKYRAMPHDDANYKSGKPDAETYKRVQLYLAHLFTSIGGPQIWNGEEMGMWGGDDPEPRKPLWWKGMNFAPETRTNFQPGPKLFDSVGFNQPHFDWYKKLIAIRKANPVLSKGSLTFTTAEGKLLAYKRADQSGEIWVLLNAGKEAGTIPVPAGRYVNLLNDKAVNGGNVQVGPLEAMVLNKN
jgi:cyclomaltodextrinase / maltogenic alpha-amylase / neopullulanase